MSVVKILIVCISALLGLIIVGAIIGVIREPSDAVGKEAIEELRREILDLKQGMKDLRKEIHDVRVSAKPKSVKKAVQPKLVKKETSSNPVKSKVSEPKPRRQIKTLDWSKSVKEQGIAVGDFIRVVGFSASRPNNHTFVIDSEPGAPWRRTFDDDKVAGVTTSFTSSVLRSPGAKKHNMAWNILEHEGRTEEGYNLAFEVTGQVHSVSKVFRSYDTGLERVELDDIILKQSTCKFRPLH